MYVNKIFVYNIYIIYIYENVCVCVYALHSVSQKTVSTDKNEKLSGQFINAPLIPRFLPVVGVHVPV